MQNLLEATLHNFILPTNTYSYEVVYGRTGQSEVLTDRTGPAIFYGPVLTDQDRTFQKGHMGYQTV